jgi:hypothetical protein
MDAGLLGEVVRKTIAAVDPAVPMAEFHTQSALIDRHLRTSAERRAPNAGRRAPNADPMSKRLRRP